MAALDTTQHEELIERIVSLTKSEQSIPFYLKAIEQLGPDLVDSELGELRYRVHLGEVQSPGKYFTSLLQQRLSVPNAEPKKSAKQDPLANHKYKNQESYHSPTALELFQELRTIKVRDDIPFEEGGMEIPYSDKTIPWATFIGPDFFTLSTNKQKSDQVMAKFHMLGGQMKVVPLIRGKYFPNDEARGILTTDEGRILGALENIWVQQGCQYSQFRNGAFTCFCKAPVREVAKLLGWQGFSGADLNFLKRKIVNLKMKPYYLDLEAVEEFRLAGIKGYGFTLVDGIELIDKIRNAKEKTTLLIRFSDPYSRQLLARRVVTRPKEMLQIRSELAFLIRLYLEPILIKRGVGVEHAIELLNLIETLNLPEATWHKFKSRRKSVFSKCFSELNGMKTVDGDEFNVRIEQGLNRNDFMLVAKLESKSSL